MSAVVKGASVLGGLAVTGAAANYAYKSPEQSFSESALSAAGHSADKVTESTPAPKL